MKEAWASVKLWEHPKNHEGDPFCGAPPGNRENHHLPHKFLWKPNPGASPAGAPKLHLPQQILLKDVWLERSRRRFVFFILIVWPKKIQHVLSSLGKKGQSIFGKSIMFIQAQSFCFIPGKCDGISPVFMWIWFVIFEEAAGRSDQVYFDANDSQSQGRRIRCSCASCSFSHTTGGLEAPFRVTVGASPEASLGGFLCDTKNHK